jgi:hypothetical protein
MRRAAKASRAQHDADADAIRERTHERANLLQADSNTISRE